MCDRIPVDPVDLTTTLVRCPSVTPVEGGALKHLQTILETAGFFCHRVDRNGTPNLFARWGPKSAQKTFGFNGHTDVVPAGDVDAWTHPPFGAHTTGGWLYGRGASDMKSGVAAFAAAAIDFVSNTPPNGAIILTITGDEEGPSLDGTRAIMDWMAHTGESMHVCIVGEPTCRNQIGDTIKIGRRGSMTTTIDIVGKQGHAAYPEKAINPMPAVGALAHRLSTARLDDGTAHFDPSTLSITTIDTDNTASNVIPAHTRMVVNIRFNDTHSATKLARWLRLQADRVAQDTGTHIEMKTHVSGEAFLTPPGALSALIAKAVETETGITPTMSTGGGTSDARFIKDHCSVVEFGLVGHGMHEVDERVWIQDIHDLKRVYERIMADYFMAQTIPT